MDQTVVDVGDEPVVPGAEAVVFGPGAHGEPTVDDWARWAGTIPHEIVTGIGPRVSRSHVHQAEEPARV
jgi:alanine racemase